jgi:N-methylhydantoinase A
MARLAIDIGGTFTDLVHFDDATGRLTTSKVLTTPGDLADGVLGAIRQSGIEPREVSYFLHGGTTVVNAITERKGARTALINTEGFRDVLELGRANRPDMFNIRYRKPEPFVPRRLRFEVRGRIDAQGCELEPLQLEDLEGVVARCREQKVEAIAIMLVNSYANPVHEEECAQYLRAELPAVPVTASHEITREWREYERASTAVLNAYVQPLVKRYLERLEAALSDMGIRGPYNAMQSNGGTTTFVWAKEHPITLLESGPAAGVNGAALAGAQCGEDNVIYLDIGGTTAKCSTIEAGKPKVTTGHAHGAGHGQPGYPVRVPVVDIVEIGAGGGSVAWFDAADSLRVGPHSAGAEPGPACYGRGGREPTVTDAKLIAGVLNPAYFAAQQFDLDVAKARSAMAKIAEGLVCTVEEAAMAVIRLVEATMIDLLKLVSVERGHDPRDFVLIVGGGGGAMHAGVLGRELGVRQIIVPPHPGLFSAWGMLATEPRCDFARTVLRNAVDISDEEMLAIAAELRRRAEDYFAQSNVLPASLSHVLHIDLRYVGQEHTVTVPVANLEAPTVESALAGFHAAHEHAYTFSLADTPVEFVTFRLSATARVPRPKLTPLDSAGRSADAARMPARLVDFGEDGQRDTAVFRRDRLPVDFAARGPLIIEEESSTTVVYPGQRLEVDTLGFLRIFET